LKAFIVYHGRSLTRTHDLIALLAVCAEIEPSLATLQDDCRKLSYYGITARYPDDL
jgi:HEPN domain-containing protein